jgi:hypothetical protein
MLYIKFNPNFGLEFAWPAALESLREPPEGLERLWQKLSLGDFAAAEVRVVNTGELTRGIDPPVLLGPEVPAQIEALWAVWRPDFLTILAQHPSPRRRDGTPARVLCDFAWYMLGTDAGRTEEPAPPRWQLPDRQWTYSEWVYRQLFAHIKGDAAYDVLLRPHDRQGHVAPASSARTARGAVTPSASVPSGRSAFAAAKRDPVELPDLPQGKREHQARPAPPVACRGRPFRDRATQYQPQPYPFYEIQYLVGTEPGGCGGLARCATDKREFV